MPALGRTAAVAPRRAASRMPLLTAEAALRGVLAAAAPAAGVLVAARSTPTLLSGGSLARPARVEARREGALAALRAGGLLGLGRPALSVPAAAGALRLLRGDGRGQLGGSALVAGRPLRTDPAREHHPQHEAQGQRQGEHHQGQERRARGRG